MAKDFHLKDCVNREPQTASGFRDHIIARIRAMLAAPMRCRFPKEDCASLREMLHITEAIREKKPMDEAILLEKLSEVAKIQFTLQPETRRQLARVIPWLPTQWQLTPKLHGDASIAWGKVIVATAQLKILTFLDPISAEDKPFLEVIDLVCNEIASLRRLGARTPRPHQAIKQSFEYTIRKRNSNTHQSQREIPGQRDKHWERPQLVRTDECLGVAIPTSKFWSRFEECLEVLKANYGNIVPSALSVPVCRSVQLVSCLKILDRGFLLPNQLLEKTKQLENDLRIPGYFDGINNRISEYHQMLQALATEDTVIAHVFEQPEILQSLHAEVEDAVCASFRTKRVRSNRCSEAKLTTKSLTDNKPQKETQTWVEATQPPRKSLQNKVDTIDIRQITVSRWCFKTRLDDSALEELLENEMDVGTFPDVWHSVAYHVNKHAPDMLVEDYIRESQKLFKDYWVGQLEKRLADRRLNCYIYGDENWNLWAKAVHCSMGDGCYSWEGRTIWYHPPGYLLGFV